MAVSISPSNPHSVGHRDAQSIVPPQIAPSTPSRNPTSIATNTHVTSRHITAANPAITLMPTTPPDIGRHCFGRPDQEGAVSGVMAKSEASKHGDSKAHESRTPGASNSPSPETRPTQMAPQDQPEGLEPRAHSTPEALNPSAMKPQQHQAQQPEPHARKPEGAGIPPHDQPRRQESRHQALQPHLAMTSSEPEAP